MVIKSYFMKLFLLIIEKFDFLNEMQPRKGGFVIFLQGLPA